MKQFLKKLFKKKPKKIEKDPHIEMYEDAPEPEIKIFEKPVVSTESVAEQTILETKTETNKETS